MEFFPDPFQSLWGFEPALVVLLPPNDHLAWHIRRNRLRRFAEPAIQQYADCGDAYPRELIFCRRYRMEAVNVPFAVVTSEAPDVLCERLAGRWSPCRFPARALRKWSASRLRCHHC